MLRVWYKTHNWGHLSALVPIDKLVEWLKNWKVDLVRVENIVEEGENSSK